MRLPLFLLYFGMTLSGAATAATSCPSEPRTAAGVRLAEDRWVTALEGRNSRALDCILEAGFADTSWRGELVTRSQVLERLPNRPAAALTLSKVEARLIGDVAIVRGVNAQGHGSRPTESVRFVDVFVYRSGRWQAVSAQESLIQ
jgi:hypothetical protein